MCVVFYYAYIDIHIHKHILYMYICVYMYCSSAGLNTPEDFQYDLKNVSRFTGPSRRNNHFQVTSSLKEVLFSLFVYLVVSWF